MTSLTSDHQPVRYWVHAGNPALPSIRARLRATESVKVPS